MPGEDPTGLIFDSAVPGDDCLNLNIWTRDQGAARLPVMVWSPGGSFHFSSGGGYDGSRFARDGVVCVTINWRTGADGFLYLGDGDDGVNLGLLDQIAALTWVRDNIAAFGGDPDRVTVFGESAGAMSIGVLLAAPRAEGLFRRAILQSGAAHHVIAASDAARIAAGTGADLDVLVGTNSDAWRMFPVLGGFLDQITDEILAGPVERYGSWSLAAFGLPAETALPAYAAAHPGCGPGDVLADVLTDCWVRVPAVRLADAHAAAPAGTYMYQFTWSSPAFGGRLGSCHALEIPFVFDTGRARPDAGRHAGRRPSPSPCRRHARRVGAPRHRRGSRAGRGTTSSVRRFGSSRRSSPTRTPANGRCGPACADLDGQSSWTTSSTTRAGSSRR